MVQFDNTVYDDSHVMQIYIDVNGKRKPNQFGRDVFVFELRKDGRLYTIGNSNDCPGVADFACAARIMENGWKMDY